MHEIGWKVHNAKAYFHSSGGIHFKAHVLWFVYKIIFSFNFWRGSSMRRFGNSISYWLLWIQLACIFSSMDLFVFSSSTFTIYSYSLLITLCGSMSTMFFSYYWKQLLYICMSTHVQLISDLYLVMQCFHVRTIIKVLLHSLTLIVSLGHRFHTSLVPCVLW